MSESFSNLPQLFSNAYQWLCRSRKNHPPDSDIWNLKRTWHSQAEAMMESFRTGTYQFDVLHYPAVKRLISGPPEML